MATPYNSISDRVVEVVTTESIEQNDTNTKTILEDISAKLPPHFRFTGIKDKSRNLISTSKATASYLLVLGVSLKSIGKILDAFHEGGFEKIIICDTDVHDFDVKKLLHDFVHMASYRGVYRLGTTDKQEITRRLNSLVLVRNGSDLKGTLVSLDGQTDKEKVALKEKAKLEKEQKEAEEKAKQEALTPNKEEELVKAAKLGVDPLSRLNQLL